MCCGGACVEEWKVSEGSQLQSKEVGVASNNKKARNKVPVGGRAFAAWPQAVVWWHVWLEQGGCGVRAPLITSSPSPLSLEQEQEQENERRTNNITCKKQNPECFLYSNDYPSPDDGCSFE